MKKFKINCFLKDTSGEFTIPYIPPGYRQAFNEGFNTKEEAQAFTINIPHIFGGAKFEIQEVKQGQASTAAPVPWISDADARILGAANTVLSAGDVFILKWQYHNGQLKLEPLGKFWESFMQTVILATENQKDELKKAYPEIVDAFRSYRHAPDYWNSIQRIAKQEGLLKTDSY